MAVFFLLVRALLVVQLRNILTGSINLMSDPVGAPFNWTRPRKKLGNASGQEIEKWRKTYEIMITMVIMQMIHQLNLLVS